MLPWRPGMLIYTIIADIFIFTIFFYLVIFHGIDDCIGLVLSLAPVWRVGTLPPPPFPPPSLLFSFVFSLASRFFLWLGGGLLFSFSPLSVLPLFCFFAAALFSLPLRCFSLCLFFLFCCSSPVLPFLASNSCSWDLLVAPRSFLKPLG